jgi:hypothetical protein
MTNTIGLKRRHSRRWFHTWLRRVSAAWRVLRGKSPRPAPPAEYIYDENGDAVPF